MKDILKSVKATAQTQPLQPLLQPTLPEEIKLKKSLAADSEEESSSGDSGSEDDMWVEKRKIKLLGFFIINVKTKSTNY